MIGTSEELNDGVGEKERGVEDRGNIWVKIMRRKGGRRRRSRRRENTKHR